MTSLHQLSSLLALTAALPAQLTWIANPATGNDYALVSPMTWNAAQAHAETLGAQLCVIDDVAENDWVADHFLNFFGIYIGGSDTGSNGAPPLAAAANTQALASGATAVTTLTNLPAPSGASVGFLSLGRIQVPLDVLGMPGCEALVDIAGAWTAVRPYAGASATWQATLPNLSVIRGLHFHMQALMLEASANGFGTTTSGALEVYVGF